MTNICHSCIHLGVLQCLSQPRFSIAEKKKEKKKDEEEEEEEDDDDDDDENNNKNKKKTNSMGRRELLRQEAIGLTSSFV